MFLAAAFISVVVLDYLYIAMPKIYVIKNSIPNEIPTYLNYLIKM